VKDFSKVIVEWYRENRRTLPWRESNDPYRIWLSEVILQQTRVNQGLPYYISFTNAFPSVIDLANASEDNVLRLWQGLGYYSRARNLHKGAKVVAEDYNGRFPSSFDKLITLPGIGPYTAAAIASIAFNEKVAVVDGNVFRVLARIFGIDLDISSNEGKRHFQQLANKLISEEHPGDHNQAVMEFGATHCTPLNPKCTTCPFNKKCIAFKKDLVSLLPVKEKKLKKRTRHFYYFILRDKNKIAMRKRNGRDIWNGLYEFFLIESTVDRTAGDLMKTDPLLTALKKVKVHDAGSVRHVLTHQLLIIRFFEIEVDREHLAKKGLIPDTLTFVSMKQAEDFPKPIAITRFLQQIEK
jgi:A/G-specific adenine glycosylase